MFPAAVHVTPLAAVVAVAAVDCADSPAAFVAETLYEYVVPALKPESWYVVALSTCTGENVVELPVAR
jgi:hypothetical protein